MVSAKDAHTAGEHLLEQRDREVAPALLQVLEGAGAPFGGGIDGVHSSLDSGDGAGNMFILRSKDSRALQTLTVRWSGLTASSHILNSATAAASRLPRLRAQPFA